MIRLGSSLLALLLSNAALAAQVFDVSPGDTVTAKISMRAMNRVAIDNGRLTGFPYTTGELIVEKDEPNGQVFIRPTAIDSTRPINAFAIDGRGRTYTLLLLPTDIPAESVILRPRASKVDKSSIEGSGHYFQVLKNMVLAIATDDNPPGIEVREVMQDIPLWQEARLTIQKLFVGNAVVGEQYKLTNISEKPMVVQEQELDRRGVLAISVENMNLAPGESTNVFIVREKKDDE